MLKGLMMDTPLCVSSLLVHADRYHGDTEIVSRTAEGPVHRYTYADAHRRSRQLANALMAQGITTGDRVATLAWNGYRHFELYYAISGVGAVTHTINPRLAHEQIAWIVNHADDKLLCFDISFAALVDAIAPKCPGVRAWIAMTDRAHLPKMRNVAPLCFEDLLSEQSDHYQWPMLDERMAAGLCYTSGTTGDPKGALYSHRSIMLHSFAAALPDTFGISATDCVLPVVPMFHVNAWSLPFLCPMVGAKLVFPGPALDGASLVELFEKEGVTLSAGVPTVWLGLLQHLRESGAVLSTLKRMVVGGSACPPDLMRSFEREYGVQMDHAWGMTELSPLGTYGRLKQNSADLPEEDQFALRLKQGRPPFGIDLRVVDESGREIVRDGRGSGELMVRGPWVIERYFRSEASALVDGWFATGDVATIDADGFLQITDRSKDMIKSGGEWISSIELENIAMQHPAIALAAVVAVPHPKWGERPLLVVTQRPGCSAHRDEILDLYKGGLASWQRPDDVAVVEQMPLGATGKIMKNQLRDDFRSRYLVEA
jgi:acyl-CoA synthetase (AMP-forming)/AMP-acid ligase II